MKNKGFTLIELMVVVAIIGIIAAVITKTFFKGPTATISISAKQQEIAQNVDVGAAKYAQMAKMVEDIKSMKTVIRDFRDDDMITEKEFQLIVDEYEVKVKEKALNKMRL